MRMGSSSTVPPGPPDPPVRLLGDSVPVISNQTTWQALRVGLTSAAYLGPKTRIVFDGALIPYAKVRDEDSHWLRQSPNDLGPAPNIHIKGEGYGVQLDLELHEAITNAWEVGAGLRYWKLRATDGTRSAVGVSVPLSELESQRAGITPERDPYMVTRFPAALALAFVAGAPERRSVGHAAARRRADLGADPREGDAGGGQHRRAPGSPEEQNPIMRDPFFRRFFGGPARREPQSPPARA